MIPARGKILVRAVETPDTLPGGQILLTEATRKDLTAQQAEVVAYGLPVRCEDEDCERPHCAVTHRGWDFVKTFWTHDFDVDVGAWVLLAPRCLVETDEPNLYVCSQDDVYAVLEA